MILIPAGPFWMGSETGRDDERPRHQVHLEAYEIDKYEVSNARYRAFIDAGGYSDAAFWSGPGWAWRRRWGVTQPRYWVDPTWNAPAQPVVGVSWFEAEAFCSFVRRRLPTEAEWEKAARGTDERAFPWGDDWGPGKANGPNGTGTVPIGAYPAGVSPFGVHDMAGNAWEWVEDWYGEEYYAVSPPQNPPGPATGLEKGFRGGSWFSSSPQSVGTTYREHTNGYMVNIRDTMTGFRCARTPGPSGSPERK
jgi:formylglycine-generating enzyme required for sulfatase activity